MPSLSDTGGGEAAPAMSRGVQEKLAAALILTENPAGGAAARVSEIRDYYRAAGGRGPAAAPPKQPRPLSADGLTPFRLFCVPIADMLGDEPLAPGSTRIAQAVAASCWQVVSDQIGMAERDSVAREVAALAGGTTLDGEAVDAIGRRWWPCFEHALSAAIADTLAGRSRALAERTPKHLLEHAETIAAALRVARPIQQLKRLLGEPPFAYLAAAQREAVRATLERAARTGGDPRVAVHVVAHRMRNPAEMFLATADWNLGHASAQGWALSEAREAVILSHAAEQLAALEDPIADAAGLAAAVDRVEIAGAALAAASDFDQHGGSADFLRDVGRLQEALADQFKIGVVPALRAEIAAVWRAPAAAASPGAAAILDAEGAARAVARLMRSAVLIGAESTVLPLVAAILDDIEMAIGGLALQLAQAAKPDREFERATMLVSAVRVVEILAGSDRAFSVVSEHRALLEGVWAQQRADSVALGRGLK